MITKNVYWTILTIGLVFAVLALITGLGSDTSLTILYFTLLVLLGLRLWEEWRYFHAYHAPPATGLFLALLSILALSSSYTARIATLGEQELLREPLVEVFLDLAILPVEYLLIFLNIFSLLFALGWYIALYWLLQKFHSGRYPGIFINRRKYPRIAVAVHNIALITVVVYIWLQTQTIDLIELGWVILTVIVMLQYYVFKIALVPMRIVAIPRRTPKRRTYTYNPAANASAAPQTRARTNVLSAPGRSMSAPSTRSTPASAISAAQTRTAAASSAPGLQRAPTSVRTGPTANTPGPNIRPTHSSHSNSVTVVPGHSIGYPVENYANEQRLGAQDLKRLLPTGTRLSEDDFRCIFCYEFPIERNQNVIICSNCHHPSHELEYQRWRASSDFCSYCNARISNSTAVRVSGLTYSKIIKAGMKK